MHLAALGTRVVCGQESRSTWACHREHPGSDVHRQVGPKLVWINGRKHLIMGFLKITFFELKFIHNATHPFKVYNSTVFNICPRECNPIAYKKVQNISIIFPFPKKPYSSGTSTVSLHHPPHQPPCGHSLSLLLGSHTL